MIDLKLICFFFFFLAACHGGSGGVTPAPVTIPDVSAYLATQICPDGQLAILGSCSGSIQKASDPMKIRHLDWSGHTGNQIEDAYISDNGQYYVNTFSYGPNGPFVPANGDGGDIIVTDGKTVRISFTQNGTPNGGTIAGYWVGANCGGTGWLLFDNTAPTGSWASKIAYLNGSTDPNACPKLNPAYTQWRAETADVPFLVNGVQQAISLPVVISEHYAGTSIDNASSMERVVMAKGYGRVLWEAWSTTPPGAPNWQCPGIAGYSNSPGPGWYLQDRRCPTQLLIADGSMTGDLYGWPPF